MKPLVRNILYYAALAGAVALWFAATAASSAKRHLTSCHGVTVTVLDSASRRFVSRNDVKDYLKDYGLFVGQRVDSVNLSKIEFILNSKSAIRDCRAYITDDGTLHVDISQREPVVRFQKGQTGFYADRSGFLFPLHKEFSAPVPVVDGEVPLLAKKGFKGEPGSEKERQWLSRIIGLLDYMEQSGIWKENISEISVLESGDLVMIPREGSERFIFGQPTAVKEKFERISRYYDTVAPRYEKGSCKLVDVRCKDQIICRKQL
ncbi:MAG: hypothetical protein IKR69_04200 [Bacteroidales bacterium]|nr:hypothetical protein [Bacteroidales bacterium]